METSPTLQRALILYEQGRHELAEKELRQHLADVPEDGFALALLAISMLQQERRDEAEAAAKDGVATAPDLAFAHYALARVLTDRNRADEAALAIAEAIRLAPENADYHGAQSGIEFGRRNWGGALAAAEAGLLFDAEHVGCNNLRAMALVKLGREEEAGDTISATLAREPENSFSHANKAWTLLESGERREAMQHFQESLRLDPDNEWAKAGLVEAIKAGNPVYAVMLRYFLWMQKLSDGMRWGIVLGGYLGSRILAGVGRANPALKPITTPLLIAYFAFAILTWLAHPVFNLLLFVHPFGRHALSPEQRAQAIGVGLCLGIGFASLALWFASGRSDVFLTAALVSGLLGLPVSAVQGCDAGWPRVAMVSITIVLAVLGLTAVGASTELLSPSRSGSVGVGSGALRVFALGVFLSQWVAIWLSQQKPRR